MELALPAAANEEAATYLSQGHDLFIAAEQAGSTARPLLLYYSFMNLAKALIKARRPALDLRGATHGVDEPQTNRLAQRFRLTAQQIHVQSPRSHRVHILDQLAPILGWKPLQHEANYYVSDLLAQIPAIHRSYCDIQGTAETLHPIDSGQFRFDQRRRRLWAVIHVKRDHPRALAHLISRQYFRRFFSQRESDENHKQFATFETKEVTYAKNPRSALGDFGAGSVEAGVCSLLTADGYRYYLSDFQPAIRIHWGLAAYLAMFYFGSVARYRPTHLTKILGGTYAWAIEEFFATQPRQFLYLVACALLRREVVRPMALF